MMVLQSMIDSLVTTVLLKGLVDELLETVCVTILVVIDGTVLEVCTGIVGVADAVIRQYALYNE
jgi:hypothetical protein